MSEKNINQLNNSLSNGEIFFKNSFQKKWMMERWIIHIYNLFLNKKLIQLK